MADGSDDQLSLQQAPAQPMSAAPMYGRAPYAYGNPLTGSWMYGLNPNSDLQQNQLTQAAGQAAAAPLQQVAQDDAQPQQQARGGGISTKPPAGLNWDRTIARTALAGGGVVGEHYSVVYQPDGRHAVVPAGESARADAFAKRLIRELGADVAKSLDDNEIHRWLWRHGVNANHHTDDAIMAAIHSYVADGDAAKLRKRIRPKWRPREYAAPLARAGWAPAREPLKEKYITINSHEPRR